MRSKTTETATVTCLESGVVAFEPSGKVAIGLPQAQQNNAAIEELADEHPIRVLARMNGIVKMDRDARAYSTEFADLHFRAVALLVSGPMSRMLASFFLGLNKPKTPTRAFSDEAQALAWLDGFRPE